MNSLDPFLFPIKVFTAIYLQFVVFLLLVQYIFQSKSLNEITHSFVDYVFLPVSSSFEKSSLKGFASHFTIFLLLSCVIAGIPSLRDYFIVHLFSKEILTTLKTNNEIFSSWLDFFDILISVLILVTFGGLIFTDFIANSFKDVCSRYQAGIQNLLNGELPSLKQNVRNSVEEYFRLVGLQPLKKFWKGNKNPINAIKAYIIYANKLYNITSSLQNHLLNDVPQKYRNYLIIMFYSNFPGGLYGLIIFSLFVVGIVFKVFKLYLASPLLK